MAGKTISDHVFTNLFALVLAMLFLIEEAEGKGGGGGGGGGRSSTSRSGPGSKITKVTNSGTTRCYNEKMVQVSCPMPIYEILGISLASVLVTVVIISLWVFLERRKRFKASGRDVEDKGSQRTVDREKHRAIEGRDSSGVTPSQHALRAADKPQGLVPPPGGDKDKDFDWSSSTIALPSNSFSVPEPARLNPSPRPFVNATVPVPAATARTRRFFATRRFHDTLKQAK